MHNFSKVLKICQNFIQIKAALLTDVVQKENDTMK
jgi:hypothetical protein